MLKAHGAMQHCDSCPRGHKALTGVERECMLPAILQTEGEPAVSLCLQPPLVQPELWPSCGQATATAACGQLGLLQSSQQAVLVVATVCTFCTGS
jgi:hypothetical protein